MVEKAYRSMKTVGAGNIALGIIMAVVGVTAGILTIIGGARLLRNKKELTFNRKGNCFGRKKEKTITYIRENFICIIHFICVLFFDLF